MSAVFMLSSRTSWDTGWTRILVVEDDPTLGKVLHRALSEEGYAVDGPFCGLVWNRAAQSSRLPTTDQASILVSSTTFLSGTIAAANQSDSGALVTITLPFRQWRQKQPPFSNRFRAEKQLLLGQRKGVLSGAQPLAEAAA